MATKAIKSEDIIALTNATNPNRGGNGTQFAQGDVSDLYAIRTGRGAVMPQRLEFQVIAEAGNTAFSVTVEHSLDLTRGFQVVGTITTAAQLQLTTAGGWYRVTVGTATAGNVSVMAAAA